MKWYLDEVNLLDARDNARNEGFQEGKQQGLEQGSRRATLENVKKLKDLGVFSEIIAKATGLSKTEIGRL